MAQAEQKGIFCTDRLAGFTVFTHWTFHFHFISLTICLMRFLLLKALTHTGMRKAFEKIVMLKLEKNWEGCFCLTSGMGFFCRSEDFCQLKGPRDHF